MARPIRTRSLPTSMQVAPAPAKVLAMAKPIPREAPVIIARWPSSGPGGGLGSSGGSSPSDRVK